MKFFRISSCLLLTAAASVTSADQGAYEPIEDTCHHPGLLHAASFASNRFCGSVLVQAVPTIDCSSMKFEVIRASAQVVAGTNFKQTVAIADTTGKCLIAFQGDTHVPLPYTQEEPNVDMTSLQAMSCKEVEYTGQCNTALKAVIPQPGVEVITPAPGSLIVSEAPIEKEAEAGGPPINWSDGAEEKTESNAVNEGAMADHSAGVAETTLQPRDFPVPSFGVQAESVGTFAPATNEPNGTLIVDGISGNGMTDAPKGPGLSLAGGNGFTTGPVGTAKPVVDVPSSNSTFAPVVNGLSGNGMTEAPQGPGLALAGGNGLITGPPGSASNSTFAAAVNGISSTSSPIESGSSQAVGAGIQQQTKNETGALAPNAIQKDPMEKAQATENSTVNSPEVASIVEELEGEVEEIEKEDQQEDDESTWKFAGRTDECSRFGWSPAEGIVFKCDKTAYVCGDSAEFMEKFVLLLEDHIVDGCDMGEITEIFSSRVACNFFPKNEHYFKLDGTEREGHRLFCPNGATLSSYYMFCTQEMDNYFCDGKDCETCSGTSRQRKARRFLRSLKNVQ